MRQCALYKILVSSLAAMFLLSVNADKIAENQSELKAIQNEISSLKKQIQRDEKTLKDERNTLQHTEQDIAQIIKKLNQTQAQVEAAKTKQAQIKSQVDEERLRIETELSKLGDIVLSQHSIGESGYLKLLLGQQDPGSIERSLVYYKYLAQLTADSVTNSREQVKELIELEEKHRAQEEVLSQLLAQQTQQRQQLKESQSKRKTAIASLDNQLTKSANRIGRLKEDERRIEKLVKGLQLAAQKRKEAKAREAAKAAEKRKKTQQQQTASISKKTTTVIQPVIQRVSNDGLGKLKGRLNMPIQGKISSAYGTTKRGSGVKWNGLMMAVNEGAPVRSVYDGQVVYADWFKGFGQLVIIDHGKGYMSLYSHNSQITRSLGEQIKADEVIAYAGSTGGLDQPGLYFEIRYNGEPRDPLLWIKR